MEVVAGAQLGTPGALGFPLAMKALYRFCISVMSALWAAVGLETVPN